MKLLKASLILIALSSCSKSNVLKYYRKPYYTESNIISEKTPLTLRQEVLYNYPGSIDEEFVYYLDFTFIDTAKAKNQRIINVAADTSIIKTKYGIFSVWNWSEEKYSIFGELEIIEWKTNKITLKENILVIDTRRNEEKKFIGTRTFQPRKEQLEDDE